MSELRRFRAADGDRLDRLIAAALPEVSRSQAQRLIEQGRVSVDGAVAERAASIVAPGAAVEVALWERAAPEDLDALVVPVLFEDEHIVVLDKPAGLLVHPVPGSTGATLVDVMRARYPEVAALRDGDRPGLVHRLDRDTSGVIAYAKNEVAQQTLKDQWRARETLKLYVALAEGRVEPPAGIVDAPLGVDPRDPRRRAVVEEGEPAYSEYHVRERYGDEAAQLEVSIRTGRTHQIRVHLEAIGHPVVGDLLYGKPSPLIERQALHAWRLGFRLPATDEWREFEAPIPPDLQHAIDTLRARYPLAAARGAR